MPAPAPPAEHGLSDSQRHLIRLRDLLAMSQAHAVSGARRTQTVGLRRKPTSDQRPLTIVDVALHFGAGYQGLGTYLRAKQRYAERSGALIHHAFVPAAGEHHFGGWHELPGSSSSGEQGLRFSASSKRLISLLNRMTADVVVMHGPFDSAARVIESARWTGAMILAIPHRVALGSGEGALWAPRRWWINRAERRALKRVDAVVTPAVAGTPNGEAVRLGLDPEFRPYPGLRREATVVFAGELSWSAGVFELLWATSYSSTPWELRLIGRGRQARAIQRRAADFGLSDRVRIEPFMTDRTALATTFASAGCVVSPGPPHRGQLVTLEAAATGVPVVAPQGAPISTLAPALTHTFPDRNVERLAAAIESALSARPDPRESARLRETHTWERAFEYELSDLRARLAS
jgi:glycosyltransferase involved in cell wall biosynthesis